MVKSTVTDSLKKKCRGIKMLILDVDGTLTNGNIAYSMNGDDIKYFHVHDGFGIKLVQDAGIIVAVISSKSTISLEKRFRELNITDKYLGIANKLMAYQTLKQKYNLEDEQIACMGDDIPDIVLLKHVGFSIAVQNAVDEVKQIADYVTHASGGNGAVREVAEMILKGRGEFENLIEKKIINWENEAKEK